MRLIIKYRVIIAFLLAIAFLFLFSAFKPESHETGMPRKMFWIAKSEWKEDYNLVLGGDSRTYRGVSPATLKENEDLKDLEIGNFGFISNGWTKKYLKAFEETLDKESDKPLVLICGLTPYSLTDLAARDNNFIRMVRTPQNMKMELIYFGKVYQFFSPIRINKLFKGKDNRNLYYEHFHDDGWVESRRKRDIPKHALGQYKRRYKKKKVNKKMVNDVIASVEKWSKKGITVFGYRPPTTQAMWDLEEKRSGYNEKQFEKRFTKAGGIWLKFKNKYPSYDGSHLRNDGAKEFSKDLAKKISENLKKRKKI